MSVICAIELGQSRQAPSKWSTSVLLRRAREYGF
jgi:hypothetical protein